MTKNEMAETVVRALYLKTNGEPLSPRLQVLVKNKTRYSKADLEAQYKTALRAIESRK